MENQNKFRRSDIVGEKQFLKLSQLNILAYLKTFGAFVWQFLRGEGHVLQTSFGIGAVITLNGIFIKGKEPFFG
jgi:hypothetical protein